MSGWKWTVVGAGLLAGSLALSVGMTNGSLRAGSHEPAAAPAPTPGPAPATSVVGFGHVDVEGGMVPLVVPAAGVIEDVCVREGERVAANAPLVKLRRVAAEAQAAQAAAAVAEAKIRLEQARRAPANHKAKTYQQEQAIAAARAKAMAQQRLVEQMEGLAANAAIPEENLENARDVLAALNAALIAEESRADQLQLEKPSETIALAEAAVAAAEAQATLAQEQLDNHALRAPEAGVPVRVLVAKGQAIGPNQTRPTIWFRPDRPTIIRCEINQEFANRVRPGMRALAIDDSAGDRQLAGKVQSCADWIAPRRSLLDEPFERNDVRTLECVIALDAGHPELRIGQRLRIVIGPDADAR